MTETRQHSPSPVKVSEDPPPFSRQPLPRFVAFDGRDIDTHVTSYYLKQSRPRYIAANVPNPIRKPKIDSAQAASSTSPARDAEESGDPSDKENDLAASIAIGPPSASRRVERIDIQTPEFLTDEVYVYFKCFQPSTDQSYHIGISRAIFSKLSPRFQREYGHRDPIELDSDSGTRKGFVIETPFSKIGLRHAILVLAGYRYAMEKHMAPKSVVQAAEFFHFWEIRAPQASSCAWLRHFFVEQKNCPNDLTLTNVWQDTALLPEEPVREIMMGSLWRKLFWDDEADMEDFWSQFFEMYHDQDENFVDVRRFSWFADFHAFIKPWAGAVVDNVFKELQDKRTRGEQVRAGVNDFRAYVEAIKELGLKLDDDSNISPQLTGFETTETTRVTGRHLQHLKSLEIQKLPEGRLLEPIHRRPKRQAQDSSAENPTRTTVEDDSEEGFDGVHFGSVHNVSVEPPAHAVATTSTAPQDDIPASEASNAGPTLPTSSKQAPTSSTPLPNATTPQRRRGNQKGAARGLIGSVTLKKANLRAKLARERNVAVADIKDDHPLMLAAFPLSDPNQTPTKHPRSLSADLQSPRAPKSPRRNERIEDSADRHERDVEDGSEQAPRAEAKAVKAQSPIRDDELPVEHRVLDPISFLLTNDFTIELPFAGLKEHSALFSGFANVADVHQPRNMERQPLTQVAMRAHLCRMVNDLISPCHLGTWQEHFDYVIATIVFRAEELETEALRDFRAFWREPFMYNRALGSALTEAVRLDDRGKKLRALIAEKMIAVAPSEAAWLRILAQIWNVEGEVTDKVFHMDLIEAAERLGVVYQNTA